MEVPRASTRVPSPRTALLLMIEAYLATPHVCHHKSVTLVIHNEIGAHLNQQMVDEVMAEFCKPENEWLTARCKQEPFIGGTYCWTVYLTRV